MAGIGGGGIAGAAMGGLGALMKLITGAKQLKEGKALQRKLDAQGRPIETTPTAFKETEGLVRSQYLDPRFMGEDEMRQAIEARGANQIDKIQQTAGSGADALMAYSVANNNTANQLNQLGIQSAEQRQNDYQQLLATLGQKAGYEQSQFQNNIMAPYLQSAQQAQALKQSGMTNMSNAFNDAGNLALGVGQMKSNAKNQENETAQMAALLESLRGQYTPTANTPISPASTQLSQPDLTGVGQIGTTGKYQPISSLMNNLMPFIKGRGALYFGNKKPNNN